MVLKVKLLFLLLVFLCGGHDEAIRDEAREVPTVVLEDGVQGASSEFFESTDERWDSFVN